jgi:hypothetical protein
MYKPYSLAIIIFLICGHSIMAQNLETNPPKIKWQQLKTAHFRLIFPKGADSLGIRTAQQLEAYYPVVSAGLGVQPRPINIVLQNQDNESNGFVSYAPRRSEFFNTTPQDYTLSGNSHFVDLLSVHELRHVVQYDRARTGWHKLFNTLFGNFGLTGLAHISYPGWFWEGDAVGAETAHSDHGRGRIPNFTILQRAILADKPGLANYSLAVAGSYKKPFPNHYVLGYYITNYIKNSYGSHIWGNMIAKQNSSIPMPFGFSKQVKKQTGSSIDNLYSKIMLEAKAATLAQIENKSLYSEYYVNHLKNNFFTNYEYPIPQADGSVLAIKRGLSHISQIVLIQANGSEKKLHELGNFNDAATLSAEAGKVAWAEIHPDPRWQRRNYSVIKVLDIASKKLKTMYPKTRLAAPALNQTAEHIVAVGTLENGLQTLELLNTASGLVWKQINGQPGEVFIHPIWHNNGTEILTISLKNGQKELIKIDINSQKRTGVFGPTPQNIAYIQSQGPWIFYNNATEGIDNVFAFNQLKNQHYQLSFARHGASNARLSEDHKYLIFNDFSANGLEIAEIPFDSSQLKSITFEANNPALVFANYMQQEKKVPIITATDSLNIPTKAYSKWNILNLKSWGPLLNSDGTSGTIGIESQDLLSTTSMQIGLGFDALERQLSYQASVRYEGLFPILAVSYSQTGRQTTIPAGVIKDQKQAISDTWQQHSYTAGIEVPFRFFKSAFRQNLSISSQYSRIESSGYGLPLRPTTQVGASFLNALSHGISYSRTKKAAKRDVGSRWAQSFQLLARYTPFSTGLNSSQVAGQLGLTFPGIGAHSNIRLRANFLENGSTKQYIYSSPVAFARGFSSNIFDRIQTYSLDYRFKIIDPDWTLARLLHIQRVKSNIFSDHSNFSFKTNQNKLINGQMQSFGVDLSAIFNVMRFNTPIEAGLRIAYLNSEKRWLFQPLIIDIPF